MNKLIVTVKEKKYFVSSVSVILKLNSGSLIHLSLSEKLDGTENNLSNEETFKQEFIEHIYKEDEGSFQWQGTTLKFILVGYNSTEAKTFELIGLVVKKNVIDWFNENNFKDKKQDYLIYQKSNGGNSWPWLNKVLGEKFEQPNPDFVDKIKFLFPDNACIWRYRDSNNFHFLNRTIAFASRHLPEVQGWCAFDADKPLRLILFEEKKQDQTIPKLDQTWNPSHLFMPNRYSWNRWLDRSCTLSRDLNINTSQEIALIKQLVSDGSNGEDQQKGKNFQSQNPTRLLFAPGTINIGDRNIFCHTVSYEFKLAAFGDKDSPSVTMKIELDYPERQIGDNEVVSLRLPGKFQKWEEEKDEETKVKIAPPDLNNWGIIDEKTQTLKSGNDAVLYTQILSRTYSDKKYSGIYIKHEKDDEMIVEIDPCSIPLVLGSVQKYRKELEAADITLCGEKLAISVSSHNQSLASAEAITLNNSEIKLNHGKKIFVQAQQKVDFLSKNIGLGSSQVEINSGQTKINSIVNVSTPSPKFPNTPENRIKIRKATQRIKLLSLEIEQLNSIQLMLFETLKEKKEDVKTTTTINKQIKDNTQKLTTKTKELEDLKNNNLDRITVSSEELFSEDPEDFLKNNILFPLGSHSNVGDANLYNSPNRFQLQPHNNGDKPSYVLKAVDNDNTPNIQAGYFPYKAGNIGENFSNVGNTVIRKTDHQAPYFVFTGGMNGCALTVTENNDEQFKVWHFQSPSSNKSSQEKFKEQKKPNDWYGYDEYHHNEEMKESYQHMEATVFLYKDEKEDWYILSQEIVMDVNQKTREKENPRVSKVNKRLLNI